MSRYLTVLAVTLVLCACAAQQGGGPNDTITPITPSQAGPCAGKTGTADRRAPIVCVDDTGSTLTVSPDPVHVHDESAAGAPIVIQWHTVSGANDLQVEIEEGCVTTVRCPRPGHCTALTRPHDEKTQKRCKYDVWTDKHPRLDPEIIIDPCC